MEPAAPADGGVIAPYIRAMMRGARLGTPEDEIERHVQVRLDRQAALDRADDPLRLWAIISEGALHRRFGGSEVFRARLEHLAKRAEEPNIDVQVLPFDVGAHPAPVTTFSILHFADAPSIVFGNSLVTEPAVEDSEDIARHIAAFNYLRAAAESPERSRRMIADAARAVQRGE